jgi:hypothetical protein
LYSDNCSKTGLGTRTLRVPLLQDSLPRLAVPGSLYQSDTSAGSIVLPYALRIIYIAKMNASGPVQIRAR